MPREQKSSKMPAEYNFVSRRLSEYETVLDLLRLHGDGILCHVMIVKTAMRITRARLRNALQPLLRHQPVLRMRIHTEHGAHGISKRMVEKPNPDQYEVTEIDNSHDSWEFSVQQECCQPFTLSDGNLWKLLYMDISSKYPDETLTTYAIIFKVSNVIADHVSLHHMMTQQLLVLLGSGNKEPFHVPLFIKPSVDQCFRPSTPLPPRVHRKKSKGSGTPNTSRKRDSGTDSTDLSEEYPFLNNNIITDGMSETKLCRCVLHAHDARKLLRMCKKYNVSIQEAFTVASAHAFYMTKQAQKLPHGKGGVDVCHWLDLRGFHSAPGGNCSPLGMWLCPVYTKHKHVKDGPSQRLFWEQVEKLSESLRLEQEPWKQTFEEFKRALSSINRKSTDVTIPPRVPIAHVSVSYLDDSHDSRQLSVGTTSSDHMGSDVETLRHQEYHMAQCVTLHSTSPLCVSVVSGVDTVSCTVTRDNNVVHKKFAEHFVAILCKLITNMVNTGLRTVFSARIPPALKMGISRTPRHQSERINGVHVPNHVAEWLNSYHSPQHTDWVNNHHSRSPEHGERGGGHQSLHRARPTTVHVMDSSGTELKLVARTRETSPQRRSNASPQRPKAVSSRRPRELSPQRPKVVSPQRPREVSPQRAVILRHKGSKHGTKDKSVQRATSMKIVKVKPDIQRERRKTIMLNGSREKLVEAVVSMNPNVTMNKEHLDFNSQPRYRLVERVSSIGRNDNHRSPHRSKSFNVSQAERKYVERRSVVMSPEMISSSPDISSQRVIVVPGMTSARQFTPHRKSRTSAIILEGRNITEF